jgi:hypothetical protein
MVRLAVVYHARDLDIDSSRDDLDAAESTWEADRESFEVDGAPCNSSAQLTAINGKPS